MQRREFLEVTIGSLAAAALAGCKSVAGRNTAKSTAKPMHAAAFRAARRFAETSFGRIAYVERGAGDAALFLHGSPLDGFQWRGALERLSAHRRCVAPDFMAMGYTEDRDGQSVAPWIGTTLLVLRSVASLPIRLLDCHGSVSRGRRGHLGALGLLERHALQSEHLALEGRV